MVSKSAYSSRLEKALNAAALANEHEIYRRLMNAAWHMFAEIPSDDARAMWLGVQNEIQGVTIPLDVPIDKAWLGCCVWLSKGIEAAAVSESVRGQALAALDSFDPTAPTDRDERLREQFYKSRKTTK